MESRVEGDRIELRRSEEEKKPLLQRLNRIEGQVRGLKAMIAEDRYCLDEIQQVNAITAALRELSLLIIGQHVTEGVKVASDHAESDETVRAAVDDMMRVLRAAMRARD
ncbi:metal-sensing transcriptional repressor [Aurantimonas endophytica]|nr:metal-sensing transcriptional repressor [Aurantimonas endophytica]